MNARTPNGILPPPPQALNEPAVLLVDDRPANLVALEATLAPLGVRVTTASSGPEALRCLLNDEFAVILLDVQMPGMDGFETAALIKKHPRTALTPIIFVTAIQRDAANVFRGYEKGGVDYLLKPFDPTILRSKVRVFVDLFRKEKRLQEQELLLRERERRDLERRNEQRFQTLLNSMPLCVWALGPDGAPTYHNWSCGEYAGEAAARGPFGGPSANEDLVHPDDRARVTEQWAAALARGEPLEIEYRLRRARDGAYRWHVGRVVAQRGEAGPITGWIATATDIENQKGVEDDYARLVVQERQAREAAQAANRAKDEFLATLSHELRTPLNAMIGWTRMLRTRALPPHKVQKALETIERNARTQAELIEDILDVSRIITGKLRIEIKPVELPSIIDAAIDAVRPAAEAKTITIEKHTGELPARFAADGARLQQVIWNLLSNAIKFTPAGGRIDVRAGLEGGQVAIAVQDSGRGISPEFKPYVFDRFRQHDSSSKRSHGGLGLGLAIVRHLVELHGGTVHCDNVSEGHGALFTVRLPARGVAVSEREGALAPVREGAALPAVDDGSVSLSGVSVLLIEDDPDARELLTEVLQQYGASVIAAASADEALALVERARPHVLLSDIGLPGADGYALISRVRALPAERGGRTPAAAITAYASSDDARRALGAGYQRHAPKPIQPAVLARLVKELAADAPGALAGASNGKDDDSRAAGL
jgi:PAS domain S-box-containing protein